MKFFEGSTIPLFRGWFCVMIPLLLKWNKLIDLYILAQTTYNKVKIGGD